MQVEAILTMAHFIVIDVKWKVIRNYSLDKHIYSINFVDATTKKKTFKVNNLFVQF